MRHSKLVTKLWVRVQGVTVYILDKMKLGDVSTARVTWGYGAAPLAAAVVSWS